MASSAGMSGGREPVPMGNSKHESGAGSEARSVQRMGAGLPGMEVQEEGGRVGVMLSGRTDGATLQATQGRVKRMKGGGKRRMMLQATQGQGEG